MIPTYAELIPTVLTVLGRHPDGIAVSEAYTEIADLAGVAESERLLMIPSGHQALYKNRIGWAHDALKRAQWSTSPRYGIWQITDAGKKAIADHPRGFSPAELKALSTDKSRTKLEHILAGGAGAPLSKVHTVTA